MKSFLKESTILLFYDKRSIDCPKEILFEPNIILILLNGKESFLKLEPWKLGPSIHYVSTFLVFMTPSPLYANCKNTVLIVVINYIF